MYGDAQIANILDRISRIGNITSYYVYRKIKQFLVNFTAVPSPEF